MILKGYTKESLKEFFLTLSWLTQVWIYMMVGLLGVSLVISVWLLIFKALGGF